MIFRNQNVKNCWERGKGKGKSLVESSNGFISSGSIWQQTAFRLSKRCHVVLKRERILLCTCVLRPGIIWGHPSWSRPPPPSNKRVASPGIRGGGLFTPRLLSSASIAPKNILKNRKSAGDDEHTTRQTDWQPQPWKRKMEIREQSQHKLVCP